MDHFDGGFSAVTCFALLILLCSPSELHSSLGADVSWPVACFWPVACLQICPINLLKTKQSQVRLGCCLVIMSEFQRFERSLEPICSAAAVWDDLGMMLAQVETLNQGRMTSNLCEAATHLRHLQSLHLQSLHLQCPHLQCPFLQSPHVIIMWSS